MPRKETGLASDRKKRYIKTTSHCLIFYQHIVGGLYTVISEGKFTQSGSIYNVEMQTENRYNIPKRSRHYQSMIDIKLLPAGEIDYNKLNDTVIIFICTFDLFGQKRYIYEFESRCIQDLQLRLEDGSRKVYLYTGGTNDAEVSSELVEFLHMIEHPDNITITSPRVKKIHNRVATVKQDMQVEARYMRELIFEKELLEKGREQGREQGLIEGEEKHIRELVQKKLSKGQTVEQIADALEEDVTRIRGIVAELK